jgi:hypothetical protein
VAAANSALTLKLNGIPFGTAAAANTITANANISSSCNQTIMLEGNDGNGIKRDSFNFMFLLQQLLLPCRQVCRMASII